MTKLLELADAKIEARGSVLASSLSLSLDGPRAVLVGDSAAIIEPLFGRANVSEGSFLVAGLKLSDVRAELGLSPLDPPLPAEWTPLEYVTWSARLAGLSKSDAASRARDACARAGLEALANKPLGRLALVPRRLTVLAHATVAPVRLLVIESPLVGLDAESGAYVLAAMARLAGDAPVVVSTPRFEPNSAAESLARGASEVVVIAGGRVLERGAPSVIRSLWPVREAPDVSQPAASSNPDETEGAPTDLSSESPLDAPSDVAAPR